MCVCFVSFFAEGGKDGLNNNRLVLSLFVDVELADGKSFH